MVIEFLRIVYSDALYIREYHAVEIFYAQIKLIKSLIRTDIDPDGPRYLLPKNLT